MAGNGPLPSTLTLLSDLKEYPPGQKVRFLGCVTSYAMKTARLVLEHNDPPGNALKAMVDLRLLLSTLESNATQIGEWVNVIGYIETTQPSKHTHLERSSVHVQALVLWSTGPLKLEDYERSVHQQKARKDVNSSLD